MQNQAAASVLPWAVDTPFWEHTANYSGGTPRMETMDGPEATVDAIVWTAIHPQKEVGPGCKAGGAVVSAQTWPGLAERLAADLAQHSQFDTAPPALPTDGNLFYPMQAGTGVEGGTRERMRREDRARLGE
ncbi:MAG: hypothetical protein JOZ05_03690 [Acetobacteraceae bacterium]|nr:hypothetical protein [Acetobacteraceae bacterium]